MHKGAEFIRLQRVLNFFLKRATEQRISTYVYIDDHLRVSVPFQ